MSMTVTIETLVGYVKQVALGKMLPFLGGCAVLASLHHGTLLYLLFAQVSAWEMSL